MYLPTRFPKHQPTRREWLQLLAAGVGGASLSGWLAPLAAAARQEQSAVRRARSCILLWMDGGPSHLETFDPKPEASSDVHGNIGAIGTSVAGIQISAKFPQVAKLMQHGAIIRGMSTVEADHGRARVYMHTGYRPGAGGITYPGLGSTVSEELARPDSPLPNFVVTGEPLNKHDVIRDPGYRGPRHQPLVLTDLSRGLENATAAPPAEEFARRTKLLDKLEQNFARTTQAPAAVAHSAGLTAALQLMRSERRECFDLSREPAAARERYGDSDFGRGCLLARRLVEANVGFVEVYLANWDSHERKVAERTRELMTQVDLGMSALISDLHSRGLLETTLIIWMGEFGRTPRIGTTGGRDHFSRAWSTVMFGGGIRGGQVIGKTDATGNEVKERPVSAVDFMATTCHLLGVDYKKEVDTSAGRPVRIVDKGEKLITELLG